MSTNLRKRKKEKRYKMQNNVEIIQINISGEDKPGMTSSLTEILARYDAFILDIGQANIHQSLTLGILFRTTSDKSGNIMKELLFKASELGVMIRFTPISEQNYDNWVGRQGKNRYIITLLGRTVTARHIAEVTRVVAQHGLNIDAIKRLTGRIPLSEDDRAAKSCIELSVRGSLTDEERSTMQEAIAAPNVGGVVRLTGFILKTALVVELLGAAALFPVFWQEFGLIKGLWYALFHSISAFCNAGFDLMGIKEPFSSLVDYADTPVVSVAIPLLIIIGGIGFLTWDDIRTNRLHITRYRMQSKVILVVTGSLILLPGIYFFLFEFAREPVGKRLLLSFFQAVTPRTAGFNTADLTAMSESGQTIITMLMLIGGSPGSTAGGMKTTTLAVLLANALAVFRRNEYPHFFNRRISKETISQAATIFAMYLGLFLAGGLVISRMEGQPILDSLFETASAIGTVGLSLGLTPQLHTVSRLILIGLMFFGRVGGLTLIFAALSSTQNSSARLPQERITVG